MRLLPDSVINPARTKLRITATGGALTTEPLATRILHSRAARIGVTTLTAFGGGLGGLAVANGQVQLMRPSQMVTDINLYRYEHLGGGGETFSSSQVRVKLHPDYLLEAGNCPGFPVNTKEIVIGTKKPTYDPCPEEEGLYQEDFYPDLSSAPTGRFS